MLDKDVINNQDKARLDNKLRGMQTVMSIETFDEITGAMDCIKCSRKALTILNEINKDLL